MYSNFIFHVPTKVLFGPGQLNHLHEEDLPGKKALIATSAGKSVRRFGYLDRLAKELELAGVEYELFDEIRYGLRKVHRPHDDKQRGSLGLFFHKTRGKADTRESGCTHCLYYDIGRNRE